MTRRRRADRSNVIVCGWEIIALDKLYYGECNIDNIVINVFDGKMKSGLLVTDVNDHLSL